MNLTRKQKIAASSAAVFLGLTAYGHTLPDAPTTAAVSPDASPARVSPYMPIEPSPTTEALAPSPTTAKPVPTEAPAPAPSPTDIPTTEADPMVAAGWVRATGGCDALQERFLEDHSNMPGRRQMILLDTLQLRGLELDCQWAKDLDMDVDELNYAETEPLSVASRVDGDNDAGN